MVSEKWFSSLGPQKDMTWNQNMSLTSNCNSQYTILLLVMYVSWSQCGENSVTYKWYNIDEVCSWKLGNLMKNFTNISVKYVAYYWWIFINMQPIFNLSTYQLIISIPSKWKPSFHSCAPHNSTWTSILMFWQQVLGQTLNTVFDIHFHAFDSKL